MQPLPLTIIGLFLGLGLVMFLKRFVKADLGDGPIAGMILIVPLLLWGATGRLSEVTGLGVTAKFTQAASASVSKQAKLLKDITVIRVDPTINDLRLQAIFEECHDYIVLNDGGVPSSERQLAQYVYIAAQAIRASLICGKLKGVIVTDPTGRYIGAFPASLFLETSAIWTTSIASDMSHIPDEAKRIMERTVLALASNTLPFARRAAKGLLVRSTRIRQCLTLSRCSTRNDSHSLCLRMQSANSKAWYQLLMSSSNF
jgi:hypothetical protein